MAFWRTPHSLAAMATAVLLLAAAAAAQQSAAEAPPPSAASGYVGSDTCKACHEDMYKSVEHTLHVRTFSNKQAQHQGCEGCHGPGAAHVANGGDPTKIFNFKTAKLADADARCLTCHGQDPERASFHDSKHARSEVGCISCHSPHHAETRTKLLRMATPKLCYGCHTEVRSEFVRPFHHRVNEGLISCMDCHNPHGGPNAKEVRFSGAMDEICTKCHAEKRGPFTFEHPVVRFDGCTACHVPHGSTSQRMLKRSSVNVLCLECHSQTVNSADQVLSQPPVGPVHNQMQGRFNNCTICHAFIHGSNSSEVFFKP